MSRKLVLSEFKVWANKRQYFRVFICPDAQTMYRFYREQNRARKWDLRRRNSFTALTVCWDRKRYKAATGHMGDIFFSLGTVGSNVVSHEMAHAVFALFRYGRGFTEEWFCTTQGMLVGRFWQQFWKRKLDQLKA